MPAPRPCLLPDKCSGQRRRSQTHTCLTDVRTGHTLSGDSDASDCKQLPAALGRLKCWRLLDLLRAASAGGRGGLARGGGSAAGSGRLHRAGRRVTDALIDTYAGVPVHAPRRVSPVWRSRSPMVRTRSRGSRCSGTGRSCSARWPRCPPRGVCWTGVDEEHLGAVHSHLSAAGYHRLRVAFTSPRGTSAAPPPQPPRTSGTRTRRDSRAFTTPGPRSSPEAAPRARKPP